MFLFLIFYLLLYILEEGENYIVLHRINIYYQISYTFGFCEKKMEKYYILASQLYIFLKMFLFFLGRWARRLGCSYFYIFFEFLTSLP